MACPWLCKKIVFLILQQYVVKQLFIIPFKVLYSTTVQCTLHIHSIVHISNFFIVHCTQFLLREAKIVKSNLVVYILLHFRFAGSVHQQTNVTENIEVRFFKMSNAVRFVYVPPSTNPKDVST